MQVLILEVDQLIEVEALVHKALERELFSQEEFLKEHELMSLQAFQLGCAARRTQMVSELESLLERANSGEISEETASIQVRALLNKEIQDWMAQVMHPKISPKKIWGALGPALQRLDQKLEFTRTGSEPGGLP